MVAPPAPTHTELVLSVGGVPLYSARGLSQTLEPIEGSQQYRRTINGALIDISSDKFRKYTSKISCTDVETPALDGIFPGQILQVDCVCELVYKTATESPSRTVVAGSLRVVGDYTIYRPRLLMMVTSFEQEISEYERAVDWTLELEEV